MQSDHDHDGVFDRGPPQRLQARLGLASARRQGAIRDAITAILVGWAPLVVLCVAHDVLRGGSSAADFAADLRVHARSLVASPLLIVANLICAPRLSAIARQFLVARIIASTDVARFGRAAASTRRLLGSTVSEIVIAVLAASSVLVVYAWMPPEQAAEWTRTSASSKRLTPAGLWNVAVSIPLLLILVFGWLWRLLLWFRFLWTVAQLELCLLPGHPDRAAGLGFVGHSVRACAPIVLAASTLAAASTAHLMTATGIQGFSFLVVIVSALITSLMVFCGPLVLFSRQLLAVHWRGVFAYDLMAQRVGDAFERRWLRSDAPLDEHALQVQDFSALADLNQVVATVHGIRLIPVQRQDVMVLIAMTLLPFMPIALMQAPLTEILSRLAGVLL
jgi:hypothetical protein